MRPEVINLIFNPPHPPPLYGWQPLPGVQGWGKEEKESMPTLVPLGELSWNISEGYGGKGPVSEGRKKKLAISEGLTLSVLSIFKL